MLSEKEIQKFKQSFKSLRDERLPHIFNALSDHNRCRMFRVLIKEGELCVTDIVRILDISMPLASQHLKILEFNSLITREKRGTRMYFKPKTADKIVQSIIYAVSL